MSSIVEADNLRKLYGDFEAVKGSSFEVDGEEVFGVVGPNGAGKTTTLKILAGLLEPTSGKATINGLPCDAPETRKNLGFLPEESPLYEDMTGVGYLKFFADLYDVPKEVAEERIHGTLDALDLERRKQKIGDMSKGMTRKVAIARSLVNDPDVLIYDEPASGLDPLTTEYILSFIEDLRDEGKTIIFSAHDLRQVEELCDSVAIMHEGEIVANGDIEDIRDEYGAVEYRVYTTVETEGATRNGEEDYVTTVSSMTEVESVREEAQSKGGEVVDIRTEDDSLQDIFFKLTGSPRKEKRERKKAKQEEGEIETESPAGPLSRE